jgi:ADP-ribose pyrophosphatase YjhB (NUDIX family)
LVKTILRVSPHVITTPSEIAARKLPMLAVQMLSDAYAEQREDEALLLFNQAKDGKPVYMTIGSNPLQLAVGGRRVYGVFSPPDAQEPIATFFDDGDAKKWASEHAEIDSKIGEIDATDRPAVKVVVTALMLHKGKVLLGKLKGGVYVLPDTELMVGESIESAAQRAIMLTTGLKVGRVSVSKTAPYISTFVEKAGQHFLSLVMVTEYVGGDPQVVDPTWTSADWYDAEKPPGPHTIMIKQIIALGRYNAEPAPVVKKKITPKLAVKRTAKRR